MLICSQCGSLVTGGAGCIGSDLAAALLDRGDEVVILDNFSSGRREHVEPLLRRPGCRLVEADLLDVPALRGALDGVGIVWHLAANPDVKYTPGDPTDKDLEQNTIATYNVLEAARLARVRQFVFASTSAVYGIQDHLPIREDAPPRPISLYGATKLAGEGLISSFSHLFGIRTCVFRFANIVGSKVRKKGRTVIGDFIHRLRDDPSRLRILGNGQQAKSYLLSQECIEGMLFAVERAPELHSVFNLSGDDLIAVNRIADLVVQAMGLDLVSYEYTGGEGGWPGDVPRFRLDPSLINELGWKAECNSEQSVVEAIRATLERLE